MRIAYFLEWGPHSSPGVFKKIIAQVNAWVHFGHDVSIFNLTPGETRHLWQDRLDDRIRYQQTIWRSRPARMLKMNGVVSDIVQWKPDVIYRRSGRYYPVFERLFDRIPIIAEININDVSEARLRSYIRAGYFALTRKRFLSKVSACTFITEELANDPVFKRHNKPHHVMGNAIDLSAYETLPAPDNAHPRLFFIGKPFAYHGFDKIAHLAEHFPDWTFDLVGPTQADFETTLPPNIKTYGLMQQEEYMPIAAKADVALGSFSFHRNNMHKGAALKVREYLAMGIPTIVGYDETDFPEPVDFLLELPSTPDNVSSNLDAIADFVERNRGKRVPRESIEHLDIHYKEARKLAFMQEVLDNQ